MSTRSQGLAVSAPSRANGLGDQRFFTRLSIALALFIAVGFLQWSLRGYVSINSTPWWVHAHGAFMLLWLAVFTLQNILAERGDFELHRRLGWSAIIVLIGVAVFGSAAGLQAVMLHRIPPFFSNAYFLALTQVEIVLFVGTVAWGLALRRHTQWHRRLMLGATILLMEPALGRLLPMPMLGSAGEWITLAVQLSAVAVVARHDRSLCGEIHPATLSVAALVTLSHVLVEALSALPAFVAYANRIAAS